MKQSKSTYILVWMILLSLSLGVFISYFFVFVNSLFISEIGTSQLPMAYIFSGLGGTLVTWLFNVSEKKLGFANASTLFCLFFALVMFVLWYFFVRGIHLYFLIFFAYAWFWVSINFTALVFWKLPSNLFDLSENKKYNGVISTGEVISAIVAYLSVPALLNLESFTRDKLLLISFFGITAFSIITFFLGRSIKNIGSTVKKKSSFPTPSASKSLVAEPYFQLIFLSVFLAVIIQLLIDFSLMEVSANQITDPKELAKYFAFLFGGMRLLELILKTFVSKYLVREYGVFISLSSLIFALAFIAIIGLSSLVIGYFGMILIVASLSKVFERSLYRSVYAPTINILYQAYPASKRALTQNYADGFGKTIGQIIAALLIFGIATVSSFESRVFILLIGILIILAAWFFVSRKLIVHYKIELSSILKALQNRREAASPIENNQNTTESGQLIALVGSPNDLEVKTGRATSSVSEQIAIINSLWMLEIEKKINPSNHNKSSQEKGDLTTEGKILETIHTAMADILAYDTNELLYLLNHISSLQSQDAKDSKLIPLLILFINIEIIKKTKNFNFYKSNKKLKSLDFLSTGLIQNLSHNQSRKLSQEDYYFLLEERIQKYTYLLACQRDLNKTSPVLSKLILSEIKATRLDILYSLNFNHDPKILNQVVVMLNQGEKSQELIALELLELLLEEQEKKWILPILREENPENLLNKLEAEFAQAILGKEKRLISIVSNTMMDISSIIKSHAIIDLVSSFPSLTNLQLAATIGKNTQGLIQYTGNKLIQDSNQLQVQDENTPPKYYEELLSSDIEKYYKSEQVTTLPFLYWSKELTPSGSQFKNPLSLAYRSLFHAVFPKESLNIS